VLNNFQKKQFKKVTEFESEQLFDLVFKKLDKFSKTAGDNKEANES